MNIKNYELAFLLAIGLNVVKMAKIINDETSLKRELGTIATIDFPKKLDKSNKGILLLETMEQLGVQYTEVVLSQMIIETGWFDSRVCNENNNYWGMKRTDRPGLLNPDSLGNRKPRDCPCYDWDIHACYKNIEDGFKDFVRWQFLVLEGYKRSTGHLPRDDYEYIEMLGSLRFPSGSKGFYIAGRYASDPHYENKVRWMMENRVYRLKTL